MDEGRQQVRREHYQGGRGDPGPQPARDIAHERAHLARRDHWWKPLGYLLLAHSFSSELGTPIIMIEELYLIPEARGQHIGRAILESLSSHYHNKVGALKLECTPENQVAMRLYQSLGFQALPYTAMVWELPNT